MGRIETAYRAARSEHAHAYIEEPLEYIIEHPKPEVRVARLRGATTGRDYGCVHSLLGRRVVVSANACMHIQKPELLPELIRALNSFFDARPQERAKATDDLWDAAVACGALED